MGEFVPRDDYERGALDALALFVRPLQAWHPWRRWATHYLYELLIVRRREAEIEDRLGEREAC